MKIELLDFCRDSIRSPSTTVAHTGGQFDTTPVIFHQNKTLQIAIRRLFMSTPALRPRSYLVLTLDQIRASTQQAVYTGLLR